MSLNMQEWKSNANQKLFILLKIFKWSAISLIVAILAGTASAIFSFSLEWATNLRETHLWIIAFLPLAGFVIGGLYFYYGKNAEAGNNLLIDEINKPKNILPFRMSWMVYITTIMTHLFGGSAGREGVAVQMGGVLSDQLSKPFNLTNDERRILIMTGISAGFASLFGTPLAGAVFALEILTIGKIRYDAIFPCFLSAILGYQISLVLGIHHTVYKIPDIPEISFMGLISAIIAGIVFGIAARLFAGATHGISHITKKLILYPPLQPLIGGILLLICIWITGTTKYIGLGLPTIQEAFNSSVNTWAFVYKFAFTTLTLGTGFKGGEVTPLFFIGATLGNTLSSILSLPAPLLAGMGFAAVFAGAANVPLTAIFMAMELFGSHIGIYAGIACVVSYLFSGHSGIYQSQQIKTIKYMDFSEL